MSAATRSWFGVGVDPRRADEPDGEDVRRWERRDQAERKRRTGGARGRGRRAVHGAEESYDTGGEC